MVTLGRVPDRAARHRYPLAGAVRLRVRELARRPVVAAFSLQATALVAAELLAAVAAEGLSEPATTSSSAACG